MWLKEVSTKLYSTKLYSTKLHPLAWDLEERAKKLGEGDFIGRKDSSSFGRRAHIEERLHFRDESVVDAL